MACWNKCTTLNTYYKWKNDYEDNLAIQNEIFKIYDFDFREQRAGVMLAWPTPKEFGVATVARLLSCIAKASKNAASAFLEASLGEDKYAGQKSEKPDKLGICASSKGVGNTWQQVFCRCGRG